MFYCVVEDKPKDITIVIPVSYERVSELSDEEIEKLNAGGTNCCCSW